MLLAPVIESCLTRKVFFRRRNINNEELSRKMELTMKRHYANNLEKNKLFIHKSGKVSQDLYASESKCTADSVESQIVGMSGSLWRNVPKK